MKRHIHLRRCFATRRFSAETWAIQLPIAAADVVMLACEISLLLHGRSDQLSILVDRGKKLVLSVHDAESTVTGADGSPSAVRLSRNDTEVVLCYLLDWYRDGFAETKHIDIDLIGDKSMGQDCTLVLEAENPRPPIPGEEAERIIRKMQ